jgi:inhibitor of cysteine peptidase
MRFSLLTGLALVWLATAQAEEQKPIAVRVGQEFKITLQYNTATGYQWVLAKLPDKKLVKLLGTEYKQPDTKLVGAGGDMVWNFHALGIGKTKMTLNYVRPWEKGEPPAQTTNFVVVIEKAKGAGKKPDPKHDN